METALITWWSVNHFFSGVAFGIIFNFRKLRKTTPLRSAIITLLLLIAWELFERYALAGIEFGRELIRNRIADVVIGFAGFMITYILLKKHPLKVLR
ncbi:MAG TPA: hypothetical protein VJH97_00995 [Candidatus Nanoarchaeia archaeon]|nr:hypothetical protein [Candidatus Nanoarchaeia archaeon]